MRTLIPRYCQVTPSLRSEKQCGKPAVAQYDLHGCGKIWLCSRHAAVAEERDGLPFIRKA